MMKKFHENAKVTLLTTLMAIALLSLTGIAYANTSTAPGQQWTVGTRVFNGHGDLVFHTTHATSTSSVIAEFSVPDSAQGFTDYLYTKPASALPEYGSITATFDVDAAGASFVAGPWDGSDPVASPPAVVRLFFQANLPVNDQASCLPPGYGANNYWWSVATYAIPAAGGKAVLTASLDPASWTDVCGHSGASNGGTGFAAALASVTEVGFAFGGGSPSSFGANGIALSSGTATFELLDYTVAASLCGSALTSAGVGASAPIVDISYNVANEEDASMMSWYWALDNYQKTVTVWQTTPGSYVALVSYDGTFSVPAGAASPVAGTIEPTSGSGIDHSCYVFAFTGTLNPGSFANGNPLTTTGFQGTVDVGGTVSDIIASYPGGSSSANPGSWDWLSSYFPGTSFFGGGSSFLYDTWTYTLTSPTATPPPAPSTFLSETGIYSSDYVSTFPTVIGDIIT